MSNYFDALLRSSGILIGRGAPAGAHAAAPAPSALEVDAEYGAPTSAGRLELQAPRADEALAPVAPARHLEPSSKRAAVETEASVRVAAAAPVSASRTPSPPRNASGTTVDAPAGVTSPGVAPVPTETDRAAPPEMLVRAAMRWVAAGPQQAPAGSALAREGALPMAGEAHEASDHSAPVHPERGEGEEPAIASPRRHATAAERKSSREPALEARSAGSVARMSEVLPFMAPMAWDRGEAVEVSIGAIHVRVDTQGAHTAARAPVAAPIAAAPRATGVPAPSRSALSRRALRRL